MIKYLEERGHVLKILRVFKIVLSSIILGMATLTLKRVKKKETKRNREVNQNEIIINEIIYIFKSIVKTIDDMLQIRYYVHYHEHPSSSQGCRIIITSRSTCKTCLRHGSFECYHMFASAFGVRWQASLRFFINITKLFM